MALDAAALDRALDGFEARLVHVERWDAATPCDGWDVRALVHHIVEELVWIPPMLDGLTIDDVGDRFERDLLGDDPVGAFRSARAAASEAASRPGVPDRIVHLSFGDHAGSLYLGQLTSDVVIHTWDLARGAGGDERLDVELVRDVLAFIETQADAYRVAGVFGPAVGVPPDADAQSRLLGLAGRDPGSHGR